MDASWMLSGSCRGARDPDLWFPEKGRLPGRAKRVCRECPVIMECLDWALRRGETHGIWGGRTPAELEELRDRFGILDR